MTSVMRRRPPTATKPMPVPGALVIASVMPPSKANTPTTAAVDRLTFALTRVPLVSFVQAFLGPVPNEADFSRRPSVSQMTVPRRKFRTSGLR